MAATALTLGLLLALSVALLAVPLTVAFSVHRLEETRIRVRFRWLFGLIRFQLCVPRPAESRKRPRATPEKKAKPRRRKRRKRRAGDLVSLARQPVIRRRVFKFVRDMLSATHARNLFLRLRIGLGDPADTGRLWAVLGPIAGMVQTLRGAAVRIEPEFMDPVFEVESHGRFRLVPIQFIAIAMAFLLSPTMLPVWRRLWTGAG